MFILKGIEQLTNAIAKAKKLRPRVEFDRFGRYRVSGTTGYYTVICRKDERGIKTVACTCRGAEKGLVCYQIDCCFWLFFLLAQCLPLFIFILKDNSRNARKDSHFLPFSFGLIIAKILST
jgi:hypothetical protein